MIGWDETKDSNTALFNPNDCFSQNLYRNTLGYFYMTVNIFAHKITSLSPVLQTLPGINPS